MFSRHNAPLLAILAILLCASALLAAVTVDNSGIATDAMGGGTQTISGFTVANQSNRYFFGAFGRFSNGGASTFTFNGDSLTVEAGAYIQQGESNTAGIWTLVAPDVATGNVSASDVAAVCALSLYGVHQTVPLRDVDETSGTTTSGTLTLTTEANDIVFYAILVSGTGGDPTSLVHTAGSATGEVEIGDIVPGGSAERFGCSYVVAAGTSTEIGYSWTNSNKFALVAVAVAPSAASGLPAGSLMLLGVGK